MTGYQPDGRSRAARRKADEARRFAIAGNWGEAVESNRQILETFPRDTDALNRLGKALLEMGELEGSLEAYREVVAIEPANIIAQRNINRLEQILGARQADEAAITPVREHTVMKANVFVEEVGKTYVTDLVRPSDDMIVNQVSPADEVQLRVAGQSVEVFDQHGERLGQLEPKIAKRLSELTELGNRFTAYVVGLTGLTVRIILREVFRNPDSPYKVSFPRQATIAAPRPYLRDTRRRTDLEPDLLLDSDDDEELEEEELEGTEPGEEDSEDEDEYVGEVESEEEEESPLGQ